MKKALLLYLIIMTMTCLSSNNRTQLINGISYEIIQEGSGNSPVNGQSVSIHYTAWIDNNGSPDAKIDSSKDRNLAVTFQLGKNILSMWEDIIKIMSVGAVYRIYIPSEQGYGALGVPGKVPANSNLIFDIELVNVE